MKQISKPRIELCILVSAIIISLAVFFWAPRATGFAAAKNIVIDATDSDDDTSDQITIKEKTIKEKAKYGVIQGTVRFIISDGDSVVASDKGADFRLYFSEGEIEDYSLIKEWDGKYDGGVENADPDGDEHVCSSSSFTTQKMYYDENGDDKRSGNENYVYSITTDADGCYAAKVPKGSWNLYW